MASNIINTMADAIEDRLQSLFIKDSNLSKVRAFIRGEPIVIPTHLYPAVIIFITNQPRRDQETGLWVYQYIGYIGVETQIPEVERTSRSRKVTLSSYPQVRNLLDAITNNLEANPTLSTLTYGFEAVRVTELGDKEYGLRERPNNVFNRGEVPFSVETQKPRSD